MNPAGTHIIFPDLSHAPASVLCEIEQLMRSILLLVFSLPGYRVEVKANAKYLFQLQSLFISQFASRLTHPSDLAYKDTLGV